MLRTVELYCGGMGGNVCGEDGIVWLRRDCATLIAAAKLALMGASARAKIFSTENYSNVDSNYLEQFEDKIE